MDLVKAISWGKPSCPEFIEKKIWNGGSGNNAEIRQIYRTLTRCATTGNSSIRTLHLSIQQSGCVLNLDDEWNFDFQPGDRFPPLHELHLNGYEFDNIPKYLFGQRELWENIYDIWQRFVDFARLKTLWPALEISGGDNWGANLEKWKAAMDWTELRDLDLEQVDAIFLQSMRGQLPALKSLRLGSLRSRTCLADNITDFVTQLNPLSRLSLRGHTYRMNLSEILDCHGASLNTLEIHEWEGSHLLRPSLSCHDIDQFREKCPSLSKLGLDINRDGAWPFELLDPLAANRNLSSLELSFELGMNMHDESGMNMHDESGFYEYPRGLNKSRDFRKPLVNTSSSLFLFKRLRSLKQGVELQKLTLTVGDAGREYSHMMRASAWGETLAEVYECNVLDDKGDRKGDREAWCEQKIRAMDSPEEHFDSVEDEDNNFNEQLRLLEEENIRRLEGEFEL